MSSGEQVTSNTPVDEEVQSTPKKTKKKKRNDDDDIEEPMIDQNEKAKKKKSSEIAFDDPYPGSNLSELEGYKGWTIDSSIDDIIKKKEKQKKRKNKISS